MKDLNSISIKIYNTNYEDLTDRQVRVVHDMFMQYYERYLKSNKY